MDILRIRDVKAKTGHRSHVTIYTAMKAGLFPTGVAIGSRSIGWPSYEVDAINAARVAGQTNEQIKALVAKLHADRLLVFPA
jgi:prophage regulatory protein